MSFVIIALLGFTLAFGIAYSAMRESRKNPCSSSSKEFVFGGLLKAISLFAIFGLTFKLLGDESVFASILIFAIPSIAAVHTVLEYAFAFLCSKRQQDVSLDLENGRVERD